MKEITHMALKGMEDYTVENTTRADIDFIYWLFDEAISYQKKNGFSVWKGYDKEVLLADIDHHLQFKIMSGTDMLCVFSILLNDPFIWREKEKGDAVYLHRIVVNPNFKGQKLFDKVLSWTKAFAKDKHLKYIRMDTWADNPKIINYYRSFGFELIEYYTTSDRPELPLQNRNLNVALLELKVV